MIDQHKTPDDDANPSLLVSIDDTGVGDSLGVQTQKISILCKEYTSRAGCKREMRFIRGCEQVGFLGRQDVDIAPSQGPS